MIKMIKILVGQWPLTKGQALVSGLSLSKGQAPLVKIPGTQHLVLELKMSLG